MKWKENKKKIVVFLGIVLLFAIYLFWGDLKGEEKQTEVTEPTWQEQQEQVPTVSKEEEQEAERLRKQTVSYLWEGMESGVPSKETLTLLGDGRYILRIELSEHDPEEESGTWRQHGEDLTLVYGGRRQDGTIDKEQVKLEDKTYKRTVSGHV